MGHALKSGHLDPAVANDSVPDLIFSNRMIVSPFCHQSQINVVLKREYSPLHVLVQIPVSTVVHLRSKQCSFMHSTPTSNVTRLEVRRPSNGSYKL